MQKPVMIATAIRFSSPMPQADTGVINQAPMLERRDWHIALALMLLPLAFAWATSQAGSNDDGWRDLFFAWQIVAGAGLPASGPVIGNIAHLGPLWYYLLAPAFWLGGAEGVLGWVGLLAGLAYPLAYLVGRAALDRRYGLLLTTALLAPGWAMFSLLWTTHTSIVLSALLALTLAALGYRHAPSAARAALIGALASLAAHAHPTTLLLAAGIVSYALLATQGHARRLVHALCIGAVAALPLLPHVIAQLSAELQDLTQLQRYASEQLQAGVIERLWPLSRGLVWGGPVMLLEYFLHGRASGLLLAVHGGGLLLSVLGLAWLPPGQRRWAALLLLIWLAQSCFLLSLRPISPFWMSYAHLPVLAGLVALGWHALVSNLPRVRPALMTVALSHLIGYGLLLHVLVDPPSEYRQPVFAADSDGMASVTSRPTGASVLATARLPAQGMAALGARLCAPTAIYGHLAAWADESFGVGVRVACGKTSHIALGGPPSAHAWLGLLEVARRAVDLPADDIVGGLALYPVSAVWTTATPLPIIDGGRFPPRQYSGVAETLRVEGSTAATAVLVIHARAATVLGFEPGEVHANDHPLTPLYRDRYLALYRCLACATDAVVDWRVEAHSAMAYTDVVLIEAGRRSP